MLAKILKWLSASTAKSYQIKYAVNAVLQNKAELSEDGFGAALQEVIHHKTIRGKFNSVHPDLRAVAGVTNLEVGEQGITFYKDWPTGNLIINCSIHQLIFSYWNHILDCQPQETW